MMNKINGWILPTIEKYEEKQLELGLRYNINSARYAGRLINGATVPDVELVKGGFFMRDIRNLGTDDILLSDIKQSPE